MINPIGFETPGDYLDALEKRDSQRQAESDNMHRAMDQGKEDAKWQQQR